MTDVASLIADLVRAGVDPELIGRTAAALSEREPIKLVDEQAERRRSKDRERKRLRNSAESAESEPLSSPEGSSPKPLSPNPHQSIPPSPPKGGSSPAVQVEFDDEFWPVYPHRVGKPVAITAFVKARKRASLEAIMAGLHAYIAKTDDRPWCNPSTWLNQDRWNDDPSSVQRPSQQAPPRQTAFQERHNAAIAAFDRKLGKSSDDEFTGSTLDLGSADWRANGQTRTGH